MVQTSDSASKSEHYILTSPSSGTPAKFNPLIRRITAQGTPVVCVASDASRSGRLASVTVDAGISGAIAAELFSRMLKKPGTMRSSPAI